jgi:hypothetical protein
MSYGAIIIGTLKNPGTGQSLIDAFTNWRRVPGFEHIYSLVGDDGITVVTCVVFESKDRYLAFSHDSGQELWWGRVVQPVLDGHPQWTTGDWA